MMFDVSIFVFTYLFSDWLLLFITFPVFRDEKQQAQEAEGNRLQPTKVRRRKVLRVLRSQVWFLKVKAIFNFTKFDT